MHRSFITLGAFYVLCIASTVAQAAQDTTVHDRSFTCSSNAVYGLCCIDRIQEDGSISKCQPSEVTLSHGTSAGGVCSAELRQSGYSNAACCATKEASETDSNGLRGAGCVEASTQRTADRQTDRPSPKELRDSYPDAFQLLGLPVPRKVRVRSKQASVKASGKGRTGPNASWRKPIVARAEQKRTSEASATDSEPRADRSAKRSSQNAGYTYSEANRMLGLPAARRARSETKHARRSTDEASEAVADVPVVVAETSPEPIIDSTVETLPQPETDAETSDEQDNGTVPGRSGRVDRAIKKVQARKTNVKAPRWVPSNGFLFIG